MTGDTPKFSAGDREEAAATWLVRMQSDQTDLMDWAGFEVWLSDPLNKAALDRMEAVNAEVDDNAAALGAALARNESKPVARPAPSRSARRSSNRIAVGFAAILTGAIAAGLIFVLLPRTTAPTMQETLYAAADNERLLVSFPDGSTATLNRGAKLRLQWSQTERRAVLEKGEAAFTVRHDPSHPFSVLAGQEKVVDIGTVFNVLDAGDRLVITVKEGKVRLTAGNASPIDISAAGQVQFDRRTRQASVSQVAPADAFAWQDNRLVYRDARLGAIVADLNRYSERPIRIGDPSLADLHFSGVLMIDTADKMAAELQAFLPLKLVNEKEEIVLRAR